MSKTKSISILRAPPQDGEDASHSFAQLASTLITDNGISRVHIKTLTVASVEELVDTKDEENFVIFIISCAADGSVDRLVRKAIRKLKEPIKSNGKVDFAIALLGHARCENSAGQMSDTIFGTGRRFEKSLMTNNIFRTLSCVSRLETQVELRSPDEEFDPWMKNIISWILSQQS